MKNNQISNINRTRIKDRSETEFIGLCKGIISSGDITTANAEYMLSWLTANPIVSENWMGEELYKTLLSYLSDGVIDESEEEKLIILLTKITGSPSVNLSGQNAHCQFTATRPTTYFLHYSFTPSNRVLIAPISEPLVLIAPA